MGWLDVVAVGLKRTCQPPITFEKCRADAAKCQRRIEFKRQSPSSYKKAREQGWLAEICAHMPERKCLPRKWQPEHCREVALRYTDKQTFMREHPGMATALYRRGTFREVTAHMEPSHAWKHARKALWTYATCKAAAARFKHKHQFKAAEPSAYSAALRNKWLDDIFAHMEPISNGYLRDIYILRKSGTRTVYVGLSYDPVRRHAEHKRRPQGRVREIVRSMHTLTVVARRLEPADAANYERRLAARLRECGWDVVNGSLPGALGSNRIKWTYSAVAKLAESCTTRMELRRRSIPAYSVACTRGWIGQIFANHPNQGFVKARLPKNNAHASQDCATFES